MSSCRACNALISEPAAFKSKNKDFSFSGWSYFRCLNCNSLNIFPSLSQSDLTVFHVNFWKSREFSFNISNQDRVADTSEFRRDLLTILNDQKKIRNVLDFGSGDNAFLNELGKLGYKVIGVDPRMGMANRDLHPNVVIVRGGAEELHSGHLDNTFYQMNFTKFDCIFINDVLEHVVDPFQLLGDLQKMLTSNGVLIGTVPCAESNQIKILKGFSWISMAPFHQTLFTKIGLLKVLTRAGYQGIKIESSYKEWGWTRAAAYIFKGNIFHSYLRKKSKIFRKFDYALDLAFNKFLPKNSTRLHFSCYLK